MNRPDAPSTVLYESLKRRIAPASDELDILSALRRVELIDEGISADVIERNHNQIICVPKSHLKWGSPITKKQQQERAVTPVQIEFPTPYKAVVRTTEPDRIGILSYKNGSPGVSFAKEDPKLDAFLEEAFVRFPQIDSVTNLWFLNKWIGDTVPKALNYSPSPEKDRMPVGQYAADFGAVCRHLAAIMGAYLWLRGIQAEPVSVAASHLSGKNVKAYGLKARFLPHMHLEIADPLFDSGNTIYADPTFGICESPQLFAAALKSRDFQFSSPRSFGFKGVWL